jgi:hypothetical protein
MPVEVLDPGLLEQRVPHPVDKVVGVEWCLATSAGEDVRTL